MSVGSAQVSGEFHTLQLGVLLVCAVIGVLVIAVMLSSIVAYRKPSDRDVDATQFHQHNKLEVLWTLLPIVILMALALPATSTLLKFYNNRADRLEVRITAYPQRWAYEYLDRGVTFFSSPASSEQDSSLTTRIKAASATDGVRPLVLPTQQKVSLLVTASDVPRRFSLPGLGVDQEVIPGSVSKFQLILKQPGIYRGNCADDCDQTTKRSPIIVQALDRDSFAQWLSRQSRLHPD